MTKDDGRPEHESGLGTRRREVGGGLFGRQKGKRLRESQSRLLEARLPDLQIGGLSPNASGAFEPALDARTLFRHSPRRIMLEIGFGGGEHLIFRAGEAPETGFIGAEPFVNGVAKTIAEIERKGLGNIRLHHGDAIDVLLALQDASLDQISILYPDPWPKRGQRKRRFVSLASLHAMHRVLKPGGIWHFASDIDDYLGWTLAMADRSGLFAWQAEKAVDWLRPYEGWPGTRYEAKARREGRPASYLRFVKKG